MIWFTELVTVWNSFFIEILAFVIWFSLANLCGVLHFWRKKSSTVGHQTNVETFRGEKSNQSITFRHMHTLFRKNRQKSYQQTPQNNVDILNIFSSPFNQRLQIQPAYIHIFHELLFLLNLYQTSWRICLLSDSLIKWLSFPCNWLLEPWVVNVYFSTFNVIICVDTFLVTLSTNRFFLIHKKYASIRSSCIYEDVNYLFEDDLYILKFP